MSVFVFDVDDTLLATSGTYDEAYTAHFARLYEMLPGRAPSLHDVYERYFEIEAELAPHWGVKRGRVAESMVRLYQEICEWARETYGEDLYSEVDENELRAIGDRPFNFRKHTWLPDVKETLRALRAKDHILCLLTSYDRALFPRRAKALQLNEFFPPGQMRFIEGKKTGTDFIAVSEWQSPNTGKWYAVGNGESDIKPALEIGENWHGIYIPRRTTSPFFRRDGRKASFDAQPIDHPRVTTIRTFREILEHV